MTDPTTNHDSGADIAIVGMAGRFPGAPDVATFWRNLTGGVESISELTDDELLAAGVSPEEVADPRYVKSAPVLDGVEDFDAGFFGFTPKEAQVTDPQQRVFLEVAWEALENAGYAAGSGGQSVGVYAGAAISTYLLNNLLGNPAVTGSASMLQVGLGNDKDSLATRVAYALDLRGPSLTVQSYCSTSLVAVSTACTSLLAGDCDMALAGGVAISVPHRVGYLYQEGGIASPDGRCRAFDADAMGAPIGNGAAAVVLRRLDDALDAGDHVYAVIKGWAVNNDGSLKAGFPAPGVRGQSRVIAEAMANADVTPNDIGYVEAHGTGTALGDAAEFAALTHAFAGAEDGCAIGSLKTNVGHLDRAAGVTGLIKAALSLRNRTLAPTLHFTTPNPQLDFANSPFHVQTTLADWPDTGRPRLAGVSSFGIGGTNAHVVLGEAPRQEPTAPPAGPHVLVVSGRCALSADTRARDLADHLDTHPDLDLADVAHTLQVGRKHFAHRRAVLATDHAGAVSALRGEHVSADPASVDRPLAIVFGDRLATVTDDVSAAVEKCCAELDLATGQQMRDAFRAGSPAELATFAAEYAFAQSVITRTGKPGLLGGYGVGAEVARCLRGDVSLAEALRRVANGTVSSPEPPADGDAVRLVIGHLDDGGAEVELCLPAVLARLWAAGVTVDWTPSSPRRRVPLPTYPFQRARYWIDPAGARPRSTEPAPIRFDVPRWHADPGTADVPAGPCLIFADPAGVGERLAASLPDIAASVIVLPGAEFARLGPDRFQLRPDHEADYVELFDRLDGDGFVPRTVVHLWSTGKARPNPLAIDTVLADQVTGFTSMTYLARRLGAASVSGVRVLVATENACQVTESEASAPGQSTLAGLALALAQERPGVSCRVVDLAGPDAATDLLGELSWPGTDTAVAYRDGTRFVRRYDQVQLPEGDAVTAKAGGVYVLTGGLGNIGLLIARHFAEQAACRLVLVGRQGLPPRDEWDARQDGDSRIRAVQAMEAAGAEVVIEAVDVADAAAVTKLCGRVVERFGRIDGVVHAAGRTAVDGFTSIDKLDDGLVAEHFAAKVRGTVALSTALAGQELDFCVLQSSVSAVLGGIGFAAYAGANAFLDEFVPAHNQATGTSWQVIDWDTWSHVTEKLASEDLGASMAEHSMSPAAGLAAFSQILRTGTARVVVSSGDLEQRLGQWTRPADPFGTAVETVPSADLFPRPHLTEVYLAPSTPMEHRVVAVWRNVLGLAEVGVNDNFFDLGGNSLVGLQLVASLQQELRTEVPAGLLFEAPTVRTLIDHLATGPELDVAQQAPSPTTDGSDDIAIIGMAGRFPGADTVGEFWDNLAGGVESITRFTEADLRAAGVSDEAMSRPGYVAGRPVLDGVEDFDAEFFGYTPEQARLVDPQQRLFLECAWEALEAAGYFPRSYRDDIGVFGGTNFGTYLHGLLRDPELGEHMDEYAVAAGNDKDALTSMVSYKLDLRGPSISVQSFCSTSLVAVHLASRSLRDGECRMAVAGGVSVRVPDRVGQLGDPGHDGHVRCFDAGGRGLLKGDGAAIVVLKRLADALADGDTVAAVIKGSAVNNDGAMKGGYDAPSVAGQAKVVAGALAAAGVPAESISYVEAHGAASQLGDPIEVAALSRAFAGATSCAIGSGKANVGHLEHASGVTGLIKTVLSLQHRTLPPQLHYRDANPDIDFGPFHVNTTATPWEPGAVRRAGVSSLGLGGTNAHVIVEESADREPAAPGDRWQVLPLSARTEPALREMCTRLAEHLRAEPDTSLADVAHTLQVGRGEFEHRAAVVCDSVAEAVRLLSDPAGSPSEEDGRAEAGALAEKWTHGGQVDWTANRTGERRTRIPLPTYPFQRIRCWFGEDKARHDTRRKIT